MAAFMPGASPPEVTMPIVFVISYLFPFHFILDRELKCLVWFLRLGNSKTHKFSIFVIMVFVGR